MDFSYPQDEDHSKYLRYFPFDRESKHFCRTADWSGFSYLHFDTEIQRQVDPNLSYTIF